MFHALLKTKGKIFLQKKPLNFVIRKLINLTLCEIEKPIRNVGNHKSFDSFTEFQIDNMFRCRREHLPLLLQGFRLTDRFYRADNGSLFSNEEILMIGLARYSTSGAITRTMTLFEKDFTQISRAFTIFNKHLLQNCVHLITDNWHTWQPKLPDFAEAYGNKMVELSGLNEFSQTSISCLFDCTVIQISRPCATPLEGAGPDAGPNNYIQMAFYNGWKHHHGIKYLSVEAPNGLCMYLYGPRSFKDSDLRLLRESDLNNTLANLQLGNPDQYCAYGDGIFPIRSNLRSRNIFRATPLEVHERRVMTKIRVSNEWGYACTANLFPFVKNKSFQKIRQNKTCIYNYAVATLLRNAYVCLYENQISAYFNCPPPTFEEYFQI
jgi:hypothetical protein